MSKELVLLDYCEEESRTTIECDACERMDIEDAEVLEAVDAFYKNGWRVRKKVCYCPTCSKENGLIK